METFSSNQFLAIFTIQLIWMHGLATYALGSDATAITTPDWQTMDLIIELMTIRGIALSLPVSFHHGSSKNTRTLSPTWWSWKVFAKPATRLRYLEEIWIGKEEADGIDPCELCVGCRCDAVSPSFPPGLHQGLVHGKPFMPGAPPPCLAKLRQLRRRLWLIWFADVHSGDEICRLLLFGAGSIFLFAITIQSLVWDSSWLSPIMDKTRY